MGVTLDNLQIEITADAVDASKGLSALSDSLEKLKKNGSFKTVATNLNHLSGALKNLPNVHQASNSLRTLANSIEKLKGVGSVASLSNSLKKLPEALKSVSNINLDKVAPQLQKIADTVAPLSAIKAGGLNTMVNSMKNLAKVTESLDDDTIKKFADKVALLNERLGPLAEKMTNIKAGFSSINSKARSASASVTDFGDEINTSTLNMASFIEVARTAMEIVQGLVQRFTEFIHEASQWDGIKYQFGNSFGEQADIYYEKITKITEALNINKQTFMEHSAMAASMLIGFGVDKNDAREMGLGYTELAYDIWAAYNNVYESLEGADGAMAAVRSAIAGEVEPIRRAGFTIVEATLEQTAANHGLSVSLESATEAQKSYLRYLELVDQAQRKGIVGTYAREMETAEGMMRMFSQQVKSLTQAFGSLFIPILVKVMPYLQAFVELLEDGVRYVAGLFGIEIQDIGDTWNDYSAGVGDAVENTENAVGALNDATKAAKELKNATIGIDELNIISPNSATGGGGGSGGGAGGGSGGGGFDGLDIESLWDESIFDSVQHKADEIKAKLKGLFDEWLPTIEIIGAALGAWTIANLLEQLGEALKFDEGFSKTMTNVKKLAGSAIIIAIQFKLMKDAFSDFLGEDGTVLDYIEGVLIGAASTYLLYKMWGVGGLAIGLGVTAAVSLKTVLEEGGITDAESATVAITGLASGIAALSLAFKPLAEAWKAVKSSGFVTGIVEFFSAAKQMAPEVGWLSALFPKLSTAMSSVGTAVASIGLGPLLAIVAGLASTVVFLVNNWEELTQAFKDFFKENIAPKFEEIAKHFEKIKDVLGPLGDALADAWGMFADAFGSVDWADILNGIGVALEWLGGILFGSFSSTLMGLINTISAFLEGIVQTVSGVVQTVVGFFDIIVGIFTLDGEKIKEGASKIVSGIADVFGGLWDATVGSIVAFFDGVVDWFTELWDVLVGHSIVPDTIDAIVEWFLGLPRKVLGSIGKFVGDVAGKFQNLCEEIPGFFADLPDKLKEIGKNLIDGIWTGITGDKTSFTDKIKGWCGDFVDTIKGWFGIKSPSTVMRDQIGKNLSSGIADGMEKNSIKDKLSTLWSTAKSWWDGSKEKLKEYTPTIGKISSKLSTAWTDAKDWWNKNRSSLSYTPSIGKISDKLKTAWTSAKDWWNKSRSSLSYTPTIGSISSKLSSAWTSAKNWWNKSRSSLSYTPSIGSIKDKVVSAWNSAKKWWSSNAKLSTKLNISVPKLTVNWGEVSALGKTFKYPKSFSVKFAADGGIFDQGSLIWAGERGPEVMATAAGGKTGVMNVQQMQDAVYEGVYAAVSAAMRGMGGGSGTQAVNVYLDGKQITATVEQRQKERGATIMGNEVYAY